MTKTAKETASDIYTELQHMISNMADNDIASERYKIADRIRMRLSDYSYLRFKAGINEGKEDRLATDEDRGLAEYIRTVRRGVPD